MSGCPAPNYVTVTTFHLLIAKLPRHDGHQQRERVMNVGCDPIRTSSHSGRRTFATRLNAKGVGMRTIQKLVGHRNIGAKASYCEVSDEIMRSAVELV
jgi:site-specific recombinase XerD